jgi:RNA recognition motif. (a.k.a. RRM, RBD, or RNP domain)/Zinc finger C-x8-C-x5-C-x3-H type (and similar)
MIYDMVDEHQKKAHHDVTTTTTTNEKPPPVVNNACKVFINRIPATFTEKSLLGMVQAVTGQPDSVLDVGLVLFHKDDVNSADQPKKARLETETTTITTTTDHHHHYHKGFAFMVMKTPELANLLIQQQTVKHTLYLSAVSEDRNNNNTNKKEANAFTCFLWQQRRCPYGDDCKFQHVGEGACKVSLPGSEATKSARKTKCWEFMKKGSCKQGADCPFLHPETLVGKTVITKRSDSEKDCISWKTKGKCRKLDTCPYRHDEAVRDKVLVQNMKKRQLPADDGPESQQSLPNNNNKKTKKLKQPLSVRVFGLNYETTVADVREFFGGCGPIKDIVFPSFEDSGRSKGYCEVLFTSPRAVEQAVLLHETELHGRWLSIQAGKMLEQQWQTRAAAPK